MSYYSLSVQRTGWAADSRPRIQIVGDWLNEIGFVNGALVQTLPLPDELVFTLYDKNINYSELYNETREKGGTLNRMYISNTRTLKGLTLVTTGKHIDKSGFQFGDTLVAQYQYGSIRVRKAGENTHLFQVGNIKKAYTGEPEPRIWLHDNWMNEIGFTPDTLVTAAAEHGCITFTAYDKAIVYSKIVKHARKHKMKLIQVATTTYGQPLINMKGSCIACAGFACDDMIAAYYEYGVIKLQKFDPQRFGF
jgi:hypothetical protein